MSEPTQLALIEEEEKAPFSTRLFHFEDCASAIDQLFQHALETKGPSAFDEFLKFVHDFNDLSVYNAMLVRVQCPGACAVGSRKHWQEIGRWVKPDAVPIVILQPFGPVRFVFEVSDTEGKAIKGERASSLFADGTVSQEHFDRTKAAAAKFAIEVLETDEYGASLAGTAAAMKQLPEQLKGIKKDSARFRVKVNAKHELPTRFATLAHELGHIYCGHLGADHKGRWPNRSKLTHEEKELEAEAVAWLVCNRTDVSPRSREYLSSLATPQAIEGISMYAIFEAANRVESRTLPTK
jgi:hypothetical protein